MEKIKWRGKKPSYIQDYPIAFYNYKSSSMILGLPDFRALQKIPHEHYRDVLEQNLKPRLDKLQKAIESIDCKAAWNKAQRLYPDDPKLGQLWLASAIFYSVPLSSSTFRKNFSDIIKWKISAWEKIGDLQSHFKNMPDEIKQIVPELQRRLFYLFSGRSPSEESKLGFCSWDLTFVESILGITLDEKTKIEIENQIEWGMKARASVVNVDALLDAIGVSIAVTIENALFWPRRVGFKDAERAYFVRSLTNAFLKQTMKSHITNVIRLASACYSNIGKSNVKNLTVDVVNDNKRFPDILPDIHHLQKCVDG